MPEGGEERAVFIGLKQDAEDSLPKAAEHMGEFHGKTADELEQQVERHGTNELNLKRKFDDMNDSPPETSQVGTKGKVTRTTGTGATRDVEYYEFSDKELEDAGLKSKGTDDVETGGTDPVDLVSGQLIASTTDVARIGVLPLVLGRSYASGYEHGGLYGPGWAGSLDIRLLVGEGGIRYLGESAQLLDYGVPAGLALGLPATPAHGARWPLRQEGANYRVEDGGSGISWIFPREGDGDVRPLAEIRDRNGNRITVVRDDRGLPVELRHDGGFGVRVRTIDTPVGPRVAELTLDPGNGESIGLVTYAYDEAGRLVSITDSSGVPYLYEWDEQNRICGWVDRNGHDYHYAYDDESRVVRAWGSGGYLTSEIAYDRTNRVTTVTDGSGATAAYHYNRYQQVVKIVDPLGGEELVDRDRYGRVLSSTDALGNTARTERDATGLPLRYFAPDGAETELAYNGFEQPLRVTEPNGAIWTFGYDEFANLVHRTDPVGASTSYTYNDRGAITTVTDELGGVTTFELDAAGLHISATDPLGNTWRMARDAFGRVIATTDPTGATRRSTYSVEGRLLRSEDAAGSVVSYTYDPVGNLIARTDAAGAVTRFEYGPMGLQAASIDALGNRHAFDYDGELRLVRVTGPTGLEWTYTYDAAGRIVGERDFDGRELTYRLDAAGRRVEKVNGAGEVNGFEYDAAGRLTRRVAGGIEHRFAYDTTGHMVRAEGPESVLEFTRDLLNRPVSEALDGRVLTRSYDRAGNYVRRTTPSGAISEWSFDGVGNPTALATTGGGVSFAYDAAGRETARAFGPDLVLGRGYDRAGRMTDSRLMIGERTAQSYAYGYRADGAVERVSDQLRGPVEYTLDGLGRATSVHDGNRDTHYAYDELGALRAAGEEREPWAIAGTRIREDGRFSYEYDAEGRLIGKRRRTLSGQVLAWTYTWDALDHLERVETPGQGTWTYEYDPLGRRCAKSCVDAEGHVIERTLFTYDGPRLVEERHQDARSGKATVTTWDYEPDSFIPAAQSRRVEATELTNEYVDQQFHAIVADLIGTPLELVAADGAVVSLPRRDLWGGAYSDAPGEDPCPLRFPGQYFDAETGLHYNLHRYYDPSTAAYLSPDPLGLLPAPNPRAYIGNPLTESDPLGLNGEGGAGKPVPGGNLSNAERVPYGEDPMSKLAITARKSFQNGLRSGKNVAVYLYKDSEGNSRALAIQSDAVHSERLGWKALSEKGIGKDQIDSIYTELQPCGPIYHDCDKWLSNNMEKIPVKYSFDYGPDKAGQTAGMNALRRALTQVRQGNLPK
ncbi:MAG TPA: RHS repeat-associated core domain-containing protein [Actinospica sp.]|nr:RHS repeat-associated core domain-containing protein [Actinospica sp.]